MFEKKLVSKQDKNTWFGFFAIIFWGTTIAFSRSLTEKLGVITAGGLVFSLSSIVAFLYMFFASPGKLKRMIHLSACYLLGCGTLFVLYMTALYLAVGFAHSREQVIEVSIINYLWPGLTLLFSIPILKKKSRLSIILGILLGFSGVYIAMNPYYNFSFFPFLKNILHNSSPYLFAFIAAISWALYSTLSRKWAGNNEEGAVPIFLLFTGVLLLIIRLFFQEESIWNFQVWIELFYMAIFPTFIAYSFWDQAVRRGNIILVAALSYFTPLLSVFISSLYLHINIDNRLWIATVLVILGAIISKYSIYDT